MTDAEAQYCRDHIEFTRTLAPRIVELYVCYLVAHQSENDSDNAPQKLHLAALQRIDELLLKSLDEFTTEEDAACSCSPAT